MKYKKSISIIVIIVLLVILSALIYQNYHIKKTMVEEYLKDQIAEIELLSEPLDDKRQKHLKYLKGELDFAIGLGDYQGTYYDLFENNKTIEKYYYEKVK